MGGCAADREYPGHPLPQTRILAQQERQGRQVVGAGGRIRRRPPGADPETRGRTVERLFQTGDQMEDGSRQPRQECSGLPYRGTDGEHGGRDRRSRGKPFGPERGKMPVQQRRLLGAERRRSRFRQGGGVRHRRRRHRAPGERRIHHTVRPTAGIDGRRDRQEGSDVQRRARRTRRSGGRLGRRGQPDRIGRGLEGFRSASDLGGTTTQELSGLSASLASRGGEAMDAREGSDRTLARQGADIRYPSWRSGVRALRRAGTGLEPDGGGKPKNGGALPRHRRRHRSDLR